MTPARMHSKLRRYWRVLQFHGPRGIVGAIYRRVFKPKARCFDLCAEILRGRSGLEIGGPSAVFSVDGVLPVYPVLRSLDSCNFGEQTIWEGAIQEGDCFQYQSGCSPGHQYIAEATDLSRIPSGKYDFVLSCHVLEHVANPLRALAEWKRVLSDGGTMLIVVPHKDGTFDHRRPVTTLAHLVEDLGKGTSEHDATHIAETLALHDRDIHPGGIDLHTLEERSKRNFENRCIHHHVFDTRLLIQVLDHVGFELVAVEPMMPFHIIVLARKPKSGAVPDNQRFQSGSQDWLQRSPFRSDRARAALND